MAGEYIFTLNHMSKTHDRTTVLDDITLSFFFGAKIGVIGAQSGVPTSLPGGQMYLGSPALPRLEFGKQVAMVNSLPKLKEQLRALAKRVAELEAAVSAGKTAPDGE